MGDSQDNEFDALLAESSLGSTGARHLRDRTSASHARTVRRMADLRNQMVHGTGDASAEAAREVVQLLDALGYQGHERLPSQAFPGEPDAAALRLLAAHIAGSERSGAAQEARAGGTPTVMRVLLGKRLQDLREKAGLQYEQAALALDVTPATILRMETATATLKLPYVEKLLHTYGVTDSSDIEAFLSLCRDANQPGWWHRYHDVLPDWFSAFVSLEGEADTIRAYEPHYVPGLLQTDDYTRAVLRAGRPSASEQEVEHSVALHTERRRLLTRENPPLLWMVIGEAVLRRPTGGPAVMRAQIDRLIEACSLPHIRLQIMPFSSGPHPGMYGPFQIFRFQQPELPDIVYVESLTSATYFDDRADVATFLEALDQMSAQAPGANLTTAILEHARKEF